MTTTTNHPITPAYLEQLDWYQLYAVAAPAVANVSDADLYDKLLELWPLNEGQKYPGSLCSHYRGRLIREGKFALAEQMCSKSLRRLIMGLQPAQPSTNL